MVPPVLLKTIAWWGRIYTLGVLNVAENTRVNVWCNLSPEMWNKLHRGWKPMVLLKLTVLLQLKTVFRQLIWRNIRTQWHPFGVESHNVPSSLLPSTQSSKRNMETPLLAPQELNDQNSQKGAPGGETLYFIFLAHVLLSVHTLLYVNSLVTHCYSYRLSSSSHLGDFDSGIYRAPHCVLGSPPSLVEVFFT